MEQFAKIFRMQLKYMLGSFEFWLSLLLTSICLVIAAIELSLNVFGSDFGAIPDAGVGFLLNSDPLVLQAPHVLVYFFIFIIGTIPFGDIFIRHLKSQNSNHILLRMSLKNYAFASACVAFIGGFVVIGLPLLVMQGLMFIVLPITSEPYSFPIHMLGGLQDGIGGLGDLFGYSHYIAPYALNLLYILYDAIWAGIGAVFAFSCSFYLKKSRLIIIGLPMMLSIVSFLFGGSSYTLPLYLYPSVYYGPLYFEFFLLSPVIVLIVAMVFMYVGIHKKDVLL
ncbi:hypothetical protein KPC83_03350 [Collinsella sp. zg1085]|uniref:hypothetical protein n=1 Tax=Collinsella sp. zg1085 TaxID=2844380 RepID=UPI001C0E3E65|nr:hypothetical protein [Collinsella sp. zg1085]QWT18179.1 hypothetical protein KPC83_03350 [Collinsella sp. zg1085]